MSTTFHDGMPFPAPSFGALLRIVLREVRDRMLRAVHDAGFTDFQEAHFAIFSFPLPDGIRPAILARQRGMSRQAINYLLVQLEALDYVERRPAADAERRVVHLSAKGRDIAGAMFDCLRALEAEWSAEVGPERFETFVGVLRELGLGQTASGPTLPDIERP